MRRIPLLAGLRLFAFATLPVAAAPAQTVALSGQVTSAEEGAMEGVLVSAKKAGSTITITVVSDDEGRYSFPASKLEPGQYALRIRAIGYDLDNPKSSRGRGAEDRHARSQAPQDRGPRRAAVERRMDQQHPGQRPREGRVPQLRRLPHARARHALDPQTPTTFMKIMLPRMQGYVNQSIPQHPQLRRGERLMEERGDHACRSTRRRADYLATDQSQLEAAVELHAQAVAAARAAAPRA